MVIDKIIVCIDGTNQEIGNFLWEHKEETDKGAKKEVKEAAEARKHNFGFGVEKVKVTLEDQGLAAKVFSSFNSGSRVLRVFKVILCPPSLK